jgi:hypothetical protein
MGYTPEVTMNSEISKKYFLVMDSENYIFLSSQHTFPTPPSLVLGHMYHTKYTNHHKTTSYEMCAEHNTSRMFTSLLALDVKFVNTSEGQSILTHAVIFILGTDLQFTIPEIS